MHAMVNILLTVMSLVASHFLFIILQPISITQSENTVKIVITTTRHAVKNMNFIPEG